MVILQKDVALLLQRNRRSHPKNMPSMPGKTTFTNDLRFLHVDRRLNGIAEAPEMAKVELVACPSRIRRARRPECGRSGE